MLGAFAGVGAIAGIGEGDIHQRNLDEAYQMMQKKHDYDMELQDNAEKDKERDEASQNAAALNNDPIGKDIARHMTDINNGNIALMPINNSTAVPGVPQGMDNNSPIQPNTPALPSPQMAQNQPQGGPVPLSGQQPPMAPPTAVPADSPAGQFVMSHKIAAAGQAVAQGANPTDVYIASFRDAHPQLAQAMSDWKDAYGADSPAKLNQLEKAYSDDPTNFTQNATKLAELWQKLGKGSPITEDKLSSNEQQRYAALKNNGDLPDEPVSVQPLTNTDKNIRSKNAMVAQRVEQGSNSALDSLLRQAGLQGKYDSGIGAGAIADFSNTVSSWLHGGESDKAAAAQQMGKESIDSMVSMMQTMPPGTRQGAQMAKYDLQGVADTTKGTEPNLQVINSLFGKSLMNSQNAYIQRTAGRYETQEQIDQLSARYTDNNPPFLSDGSTPNPKWVSAKDWIAQGGQQSSVTQQGNLSQGRNTIDEKKNSAISGQNPSEVGNTAKQQPAFDYSKIDKGQQYTAPDGSIRMKQ